MGVTLVVVVILLVLWAAVLGPRLVRRFLEDRSEGSIDSFHHQLHLLERAGPKIVSPAYSLVTSQPVAAGRPRLPAISSMPGRPSLVLLEPVRTDAVGDAEEALVADGTGGRFRRVAPLAAPRLVTVPEGDPPAGIGAPGGGRSRGSGRAMTGPWPGESGWPGGAGGRFADGSAGALAARDRDFRRRMTRRRRRDVLVGLAATLVLTGPLGVVRSLHGLWVFTVLSAIGLAMYVALTAYARSLAEDGGRGRSGPGRAPSRPLSSGRSRYDDGRRRAGTVGDRATQAFWGEETSTGAWGAGEVAGQARTAGEPLPRRWAAAAGYPGAWDEEVLDGAATGG